MKLCNIRGYGIFDTDTVYPGKKESAFRISTDFELEFYIECTGKAIIGETQYRLSPGTALCIKPGQSRRSIFGFQCYYLHIDFEEGSPYRRILENAPDYFPLIDSEKYKRVFDDLITHLLTQGYDPESDYVNAKLLELFYYLRTDSDNNRKYLEMSHPRENAYISRALQFIRENFSRDIQLADIAYVTGYSPNYFHHIFTSVIGKTPQEYLLEYRIARAKLLLTHSSKSLAEIAYDCGFSSQSYFNLQFRKIAYTTPGKYRKMNIEQYQTGKADVF